MSSPENAFTAPITETNQEEFPFPRKRLGVWPAFTIAVLSVGLICSGSYALALMGEVHHLKSEIHDIRSHLSTP